MQTAMRGCEIAEEMAITHQNRPCFKKIDSLCARMKQDLMRPDSVLANINSQGIVWAVKDMIFVFTRIINAWNIIKGYVYNTPEGLNSVKSTLSSEFYSSFTLWENATLDFCNNLIQSFENINEMVQSQRVAMQKLSTNNTNKTARHHRGGQNSFANDQARASKNALDEAMKLLSAHSLRDKESDTSSINASQCSEEQLPISRPSYFLNVVKNSEETQRQAVAKGTYMKTGLYNPLKKEVYGEIPMLVVASQFATKPTSELKSIFTQTAAPTICHPYNEPAECCAAFNRCCAHKRDQGDPFVVPTGPLNDTSIHKEMLRTVQPPVARPISITATDPKVEYLLHRLCNLNEAEYFFSSQFTKNYVSVHLGSLHNSF